jgi:hypothetical protein|nr:MAG TPA: hypothetical protein [Caudoviricetes sp.]DAO41972.1 MAG TPA: hypothetical protein [Caudoviricetes sp.]
MKQYPALSKIFAAEVLEGRMTIDEVPELLRQQVREILGLA